jgi:hypothetical protein
MMICNQGASNIRYTDPSTTSTSQLRAEVGCDGAQLARADAGRSLSDATWKRRTRYESQLSNSPLQIRIAALRRCFRFGSMWQPRWRAGINGFGIDINLRYRYRCSYVGPGSSPRPPWLSRLPQYGSRNIFTATQWTGSTSRNSYELYRRGSQKRNPLLFFGDKYQCV